MTSKMALYHHFKAVEVLPTCNGVCLNSTISPATIKDGNEAVRSALHGNHVAVHHFGC